MIQGFRTVKLRTGQFCNRAGYSSLGLSISFLLLSISSSSSTISNAQDKQPEAPIIKPGDNLTIEGIPSVSIALSEKVRKYTEARGASVLDWHPTNRSMLVSTRFANSNQVHRVSSPVGSRYQLTFFNEPVGSASYEPIEGKYFLFTKDVGGNEFGQIYRFDFASGESTLLTDGGRSQNGGWSWSNDKKRICYGSTRRNGADRDLWIMDPLNPKADRLAIQVKGGGWSVQDWSHDDSTLLVMEYLSVNKSNIYTADVATGTLAPLTDPNRDVAYGGAKFSKDGKSIYLTTDETGEFQQLARMALSDKKLIPLSQDIESDVESFELSNDGSQLALAVNQRGLTQLFVMETATGIKKQIPNLPIGVISIGSWRNDDSEFSVNMTSAQSSSDVYSIDVKSLQLTRWTESEMGGLVASDLPAAKLVEWKSFDGKMISGFLYQPPERFTGKRARYKNVATPKQRDMRARLRLVRRLTSPLQRPIEVKFKIGAEANSGYAIVFRVSRSSRSSV
jgi:dipeptidyl aminopeptidase/acylaminoacyl peptidase